MSAEGQMKSEYTHTSHNETFFSANSFIARQWIDNVERERMSGWRARHAPIHLNKREKWQKL